MTSCSQSDDDKEGHDFHGKPVIGPQVLKFTLLIDFGSSLQTVTRPAFDLKDAQQLAWSQLTDADKARVKSITLVTACEAPKL